ncbi:MAG TPA: hypothetical protein VGG85_10870 [Terracidiphilus sp.]|jgi:hypothetical protein
MMEAPRPSTLGEILDRTAHHYRSRFLVFFGIAVVPAGVLLACAAGAFLFVAWMGSGAGAANPVMAGVLSIIFLVAGALIVLPLCAAATGLGSAALSYAASLEYFGERTTIRGAYKAAWKRGWQYLWLFFLQTLFLIIVPLAAWSVLIVVLAVLGSLAKQAGGEGTSMVLSMVLVLVLAVLGSYTLWMLVRLCLAFPASVVEGVGAWAALKRSVFLSKDTRGRILVLYLLGAVLGWMLSMLFTVPVLIVVSLIPGMTSPQHSQTMGMIVLFTFYGSSFAGQALTKPIHAIAIVLFYYDQRIRKEAFDIEWMMRRAGMTEAAEIKAEPWLPAALKSPALATGVSAGGEARAAQFAAEIMAAPASLVELDEPRSTTAANPPAGTETLQPASGETA